MQYHEVVLAWKRICLQTLFCIPWPYSPVLTERQTRLSENPMLEHVQYNNRNISKHDSIIIVSVHAPVLHLINLRVVVTNLPSVYVVLQQSLGITSNAQRYRTMKSCASKQREKPSIAYTETRFMLGPYIWQSEKKCRLDDI